MKIFGVLIFLIVFLGVTLSFTPNTYAKGENAYSHSYGLLVHNRNRNRVVTRIKALEVALKYFSHSEVARNKNAEMAFKDVRFDSKVYVFVEKGCRFKLFDCLQERFYPNRGISQRDFLEWFFKLKYLNQPNFLKNKYPFVSNHYIRAWLEARSLNLLSNPKITYRVFQEFFYRHKVTEENFNYPFVQGLVMDVKQITLQNYHQLKEINFVLNDLSRVILIMRKKKKLNFQEKNLLNTLEKNHNAFFDLKKSLMDNPYILKHRTDLNPDVTEAIRRYGLQEVLQTYTYDYSKNLAYRKHNLTTGVLKMQAKVFKAGEVIDFWEIISDKNLSDFQYGWVIANGIEKWQFGGGLCGSSTMIFLPAWKSGLEILERRSHSQYFPYLYPIEEIGLDATIYRPAPNLKILNNTGSPIVFNIVDDKENERLTVEIIGNQRYKNIEIEGPFFEGKNRVKWIRRLEEFNGKITSEDLKSRYEIIHYE